MTSHMELDDDAGGAGFVGTSTRSSSSLLLDDTDEHEAADNDDEDDDDNFENLDVLLPGRQMAAVDPLGAALDGLEHRIVTLLEEFKGVTHISSTNAGGSDDGDMITMTSLEQRYLRPLLDLVAHVGPRTARLHARSRSSIDQAVKEVYQRLNSTLLYPTMLEISQSDDEIPLKRAAAVQFFHMLHKECQKAGSYFDRSTTRNSGPIGDGILGDGSMSSSTTSSGGGGAGSTSTFDQQRRKHQREVELLHLWIEACTSNTSMELIMYTNNINNNNDPNDDYSSSVIAMAQSRVILSSNALLRPALKCIATFIDAADDTGALNLYNPLMSMCLGLLGKMFLSSSSDQRSYLFTTNDSVLASSLKFIETFIKCFTSKEGSKNVSSSGSSRGGAAGSSGTVGPSSSSSASSMVVMETDFALEDVPAGHPLITRDILEMMGEYAFITLRGMLLVGGQVTVDTTLLPKESSFASSSDQLLAILKLAALTFMEKEGDLYKITKDDDEDKDKEDDDEEEEDDETKSIPLPKRNDEAFSTMDIDFTLHPKSYSVCINAIASLAVHRPLVCFKAVVKVVTTRTMNPPTSFSSSSLDKKEDDTKDGDDDTAAAFQMLSPKERLNVVSSKTNVFVIHTQLKATCLTLLRSSFSVIVGGWDLLQATLSSKVCQMSLQATKAHTMSKQQAALRTAGRAARNQAALFYEWEGSGDDGGGSTTNKKRQRAMDSASSALDELRAAKMARGLGEGIQLPVSMVDSCELALLNVKHLSKQRPSDNTSSTTTVVSRKKKPISLEALMDAISSNGASLITPDETRWYDRDGGTAWNLRSTTSTTVLVPSSSTTTRKKRGGDEETKKDEDTKQSKMMKPHPKDGVVASSGKPTAGITTTTTTTTYEYALEPKMVHIVEDSSGSGVSDDEDHDRDHDDEDQNHHHDDSKKGIKHKNFSATKKKKKLTDKQLYVQQCRLASSEAFGRILDATRQYEQKRNHSSSRTSSTTAATKGNRYLCKLGQQLTSRLAFTLGKIPPPINNSNQSNPPGSYRDSFLYARSCALRADDDSKKLMNLTSSKDKKEEGDAAEKLDHDNDDTNNSKKTSGEGSTRKATSTREFLDRYPLVASCLALEMNPTTSSTTTSTTNEVATNKGAGSSSATTGDATSSTTSGAMTVASFKKVAKESLSVRLCFEAYLQTISNQSKNSSTHSNNKKGGDDDDDSNNSNNNPDFSSIYQPTLDTFMSSVAYTCFDATEDKSNDVDSMALKQRASKGSFMLSSQVSVAPDVTPRTSHLVSVLCNVTSAARAALEAQQRKGSRFDNKHAEIAAAIAVAKASKEEAEKRATLALLLLRDIAFQRAGGGGGALDTKPPPTSTDEGDEDQKNKDKEDTALNSELETKNEVTSAQGSSARRDAVQCAIAIASARLPSSSAIQDKALKLVVNVLFPRSTNLSNMVVQGAIDELKYITQYAMDHCDPTWLVTNAKESATTTTGASGFNDSSSTTTTPSCDEERALLDRVRKPVVLFMALCVRRPELFELLANEACRDERATRILGMAMNAWMPKFAKAVALKYGPSTISLRFAKMLPMEANPILLSFLNALTSSATAATTTTNTAEAVPGTLTLDDTFVDACLEIQMLKLDMTTGNKNPNFLIPVSWLMKRDDLVTHLPDFVRDTDAVFHAALKRMSERVGRQALSYREDPSAGEGTSSTHNTIVLRGMTLCEQLVFLHWLDFSKAGLPQKRYVDVIKQCLDNEMVYTDRVLLSALDHISNSFVEHPDDKGLPLAFMLTTITTVDKHETLHPWICQTLLPRLIDGKIYNDRRQFQGWMRCAHKLERAGVVGGSNSTAAIQSLPEEQLKLYRSKYPAP